jgi:hypothetical protein
MNVYQTGSILATAGRTRDISDAPPGGPAR